jgi:hypothetical protein
MQFTFLKALIASLVLVWHLADGRFVLTADSREVIIKNGAKVYDDNACKLIDSGRIVFFETGYPKGMFDDKTIYDGENIARGLLLQHRHEPLTGKSVDSLADLWAKRMKTDLETYMQIPMAQRPPGGTAGIFLASLTDGSTYGTIRTVDPDETGNKAVVAATSVTTRGFLGVGDHDGNRIANRILADRRARQILEDDPARLLFEVETDTIKELNSPGVGGKVDELVLRPNQAAVWIRKKSFCH